MPTFEGRRTAPDLRFAIVVARFNDFVTSRLLTGAHEARAEAGVPAESIDVVWVPGAFEVASGAQHVAALRTVAAVICLGCVIRGGTPHFDYVAGECVKGLGQVSLSSNLPVAFGVLTVDTLEQAIERAGTKAGNKGAEAALCAFEMVSLLRQLQPAR